MKNAYDLTKDAIDNANTDTSYAVNQLRNDVKFTIESTVLLSTHNRVPLGFVKKFEPKFIGACNITNVYAE